MVCVSRLRTGLLVLCCFPLVGAAKEPLRLSDVVEQREPLSPRISPDGRVVAFLVSRASVTANNYSTELYVVAPSSEPRKILGETSIGALEWTPDGRSLTAILPRGGKIALWTIPLEGGDPRPLFEHPTRVQQYHWSPDASRLVFVTSEEPTPEERAAIENRGIVYDDTVHGIRNFTGRSWGSAPKPQQIWLWERGAARANRLALDLSTVAGLGSIRWSPDGERLALEYVPRGGAEDSLGGTHIAVIDVTRASIRPVVTWRSASRGVDWSPDSRALSFASMGPIDPVVRFYENRMIPYIVRLDEKEPRPVGLPSPLRFLSTSWWNAAGDGLLFEYEDRSRSTLYRVPLSGGSPAPVLGGTDHYSSFDFDRGRRRAACLRQSFARPPEIALVDIDKGEPQTLTDLNPQFRGINLVEGKEVRWSNRYGHETNGFLMLPPGSRSGERRPLLIVLYYFSNKFTTQAQWITSYPAQNFASAGFAVLLMNYPYELGWKYGDFKGAALSQAYNPLASIEKAVEMLASQGIADPKRTGIMGWSFGAWLVEFAITHSDLFRAASAGEGGLNNAGQYWVTGSSAMRYYLDGFFSGPPLGKTYDNYREVSPALNTDRIAAPLLREYGPDVGVQSLEFYAMARKLGKPVEQVIYPGAPHVLNRPSQRIASMERNLDWFRFWLQHYEDPAPEKREQYARWKALPGAPIAR
jgi:dipeptidyl aminopeptidase/acylaminoacyl peptidase